MIEDGDESSLIEVGKFVWFRLEEIIACFSFGLDFVCGGCWP